MFLEMLKIRWNGITGKIPKAHHCIREHAPSLSKEPPPSIIQVCPGTPAQTCSKHRKTAISLNDGVDSNVGRVTAWQIELLAYDRYHSMVRLRPSSKSTVGL